MACQEMGAEVRMINLKDYNIIDCNGCTSCTMGMSMGKHTGCSLDDADDKKKIMDVMLNQDAVIFSAPTYDLMPSSLFLKFMHRNLAYESAFLTKIGAIEPRDRVGALIAVGGFYPLLAVHGIGMHAGDHLHQQLQDRGHVHGHTGSGSGTGSVI